MPNWCSNSLTLTAASKEEADRLLQTFKIKKPKIGLSLDSLCLKKWDEDNWYWSRVEAWGTKWDASLEDVGWVSDTDVVNI